MQNEHIKVFGDKVALTELGYKMEGEIILPQTVAQPNGNHFRIGKVIAVGDGIGLERIGRRVLSYPGKMFVNLDDAVIFQIPRQTTLTSAYNVAGHGEVSVIIQPDCIARLRPQAGKNGPEYVAKIDHVEMLGDWVLLNAVPLRHDNDLIIRPDNAVDIRDFRFTVLQIGTGGAYEGIEYGVGDSVLIERLRATPFTLCAEGDFGLVQHKEYYFIHKDYVLGKFAK